MSHPEMNVVIHTQPNEVTCGPTSLHAVYAYYGDKISLDDVIAETEMVQSGGTIAPLLGVHALQRNYQAVLYIYCMDIFDPSWFSPIKLSNDQLIKKLTQQMQHKKGKRFVEASIAYIRFLENGGIIEFHDLTIQLLKTIFHEGTPILTGLSATTLYHSTREIEMTKGKHIFDDLRGGPCGHFVILCGYDETRRHIIVADPHRENVFSHDNYYQVSSSRVINAILLGVLTYDANLLVIKPGSF
jgi:hypothetical protein